MALEILLGTLALLGGIGGFGFRRFLIGQRLSIWRAAMEAQSVEGIVASSGLRHETQLTGDAGPFLVRMSRYVRAEEEGTRVEVGCPARPLAGVTLRTTGVLGIGRVEGKEIETGDAPFDAAFCIGGPPALVHAVFDDDLRRHVLTQLHTIGPLEVAGGVVRINARAADSLRPPVLARALGAALEIARRFPCADLDIPAHLAENACGDHQPQVRVRNLLVLSREYRDHAVTQETLRAACDDPDAEVRLRAALTLGRERFDILESVAESKASDDTSAASAVYALGRDLSVERALAILDRALRTRRVGCAHACLSRLSGNPAGSVVVTLSRILEREKGELALHAARALAETGSPEAEATLLLGLERPLLVAQAAAEALGLCGTAASVLPLKEAAERYADGDMLRAVRQAVAQIQSRLRLAAAPGQLSIAALETGQLSLASRDEGGRLSLVDTEAGKLSLSPGPDDAT
jgi:hypothetical protein